MKYLLNFILFFVVTINLASQSAIDKYFEKYQDNEDVSIVYVSPKMFKMVSKVLSERENEDLKAVVEKLDGLRIFKTKDDEGTFYKEAISQMDTEEYEILLTAKDDGQNIQFMTKESADIIDELLLLVGGKDEFVILSFTGEIDLNQIARLAQSLDIKGAEHLKKLGQ